MSRLTISARSCAFGTLPAFALVIAVALSAATLPAQAEADGPPGGFPSWSDIEHARKSESGKAAEVDRINGLLDTLRVRSEELGAAAVAAAAEFAAADAAATAATAAAARLEALNRKVRRAAGELAERRHELGVLAAQSYKTGGAPMGFFLTLDALETDSVHGLRHKMGIPNRPDPVLSGELHEPQ